jgi:hypothetical protein
MRNKSCRDVQVVKSMQIERKFFPDEVCETPDYGPTISKNLLIPGEPSGQIDILATM